jgi:hypothetical protein
MTTVRRTRGSHQKPEPFIDVRTVFILLIACVLSLGAGLSAAAALATAGANTGLIAVGGLCTAGTAMVMLIATLHRLIK